MYRNIYIEYITLLFVIYLSLDMTSTYNVLFKEDGNISSKNMVYLIDGLLQYLLLNICNIFIIFRKIRILIIIIFN